jgi:hypothetical protein
MKAGESGWHPHRHLWEPRRHIALWASTACYRVGFIFLAWTSLHQNVASEMDVAISGRAQTREIHSRVTWFSGIAPPPPKTKRIWRRYECGVIKRDRKRKSNPVGISTITASKSRILPHVWLGQTPPSPTAARKPYRHTTRTTGLPVLTRSPVPCQSLIKRWTAERPPRIMNRKLFRKKGEWANPRKVHPICEPAYVTPRVGNLTEEKSFVCISDSFMDTGTGHGGRAV